jgi:small subunit ribosomal protein S5
MSEDKNTSSNGKEEELKSEIEVKKKQSESEWIPKTELGRRVKNGEITSLNEIIDANIPILEPEIVDFLLPGLEEKVVDFKKTTRVTRSGRHFSFRAAVLVGDKNEFVGIGIAKDAEKWPAVRKAARRARLNLKRVRRGNGSWESTSNLKNSIPFRVEGKCASVRVTLMPAPEGTGLVAADSIKDVLRFVGIKDVWSSTRGATGTKLNFIIATIDALSKTTQKKGIVLEK